MIYLKRITNNLYAFVNVHGYMYMVCQCTYYSLVNLLPIEDKLNVMRNMCKLGS